MANFRSSLLFMTMFITLLSVNKVVNSTKSLSFSFTEFEPNQSGLIFQGDADVAITGELQLTKQVRSSVGRALYSDPVQIWDSKTGEVASFTTSFSFVTLTADLAKTADGLAFFLAPVDTQPQQPGGLLGLFPNKYTNESNHILAVEFDTFLNDWDPKYLHIGVDINGISSSKTTPWELGNGEVANVVITYRPYLGLVTASLVYPSSERSYIVSSFVDLKSVLPEFVRVGISATTGLSDEYSGSSYEVLSWSFESKFPGAGIEGAASNNVHASTHGLDSASTSN